MQSIPTNTDTDTDTRTSGTIQRLRKGLDFVYFKQMVYDGPEKRLLVELLDGVEKAIGCPGVDGGGRKALKPKHVQTALTEVAESIGTLRCGIEFLFFPPGGTRNPEQECLLRLLEQVVDAVVNVKDLVDPDGPCPRAMSESAEVAD